MVAPRVGPRADSMRFCYNSRRKQIVRGLDKMKHWDTVAIIGVGLIGGSIGLALRRGGLASKIIGIGRRTSSLRAAKKCGAVDATTTNIQRGVRDADLVVVCTPVGQIIEHVQQAAESCPDECLITDAGSTKSRIVAALETSLPKNSTFVGSHPMTGSEKTGPLSAREDLFDNRLVIVTPTRRTKQKSIEEVEVFWQSLGADVRRMLPKAHDGAIAIVSHLPHLVASALAGATPEQLLPLAATGWRDTTRVASGDVELWRDILGQNKDNVLESLGVFEKWLARFRKALESNDQTRVAKLLQAGKQNRDAVGN